MAVDPEDVTEANLGTVTDDEWYDAHSRLAGQVPVEALDYVWAPGEPPPVGTWPDAAAEGIARG